MPKTAIPDRIEPSLQRSGEQDRLTPLPQILRKLLALDPRRVEFRVRGFDLAEKSHEERLESIGKAFLRGYNLTLSTTSLSDFDQALEREVPLLRGFFIEGGAMGSALVDSIPFRRPMLPRYRKRFAAQYPILVHAGVGLTISKLSWRERGIIAELDPFYRWLAYDGLGYHNMYFQSDKILGGAKPRLKGYAARAYDQGAGRGIWFVSGASVEKAAEMVASLPGPRQADLWAGVGLALCYAGPAGPREFLAADALAGTHAPDLATGVALACAARAKDQSLLPQTRAAVTRLWGLTPEALAEQLESARLAAAASDPDTGYARWREAIAADYAKLPSDNGWE